MPKNNQETPVKAPEVSEMRSNLVGDAAAFVALALEAEVTKTETAVTPMVNLEGLTD